MRKFLASTSRLVIFFLPLALLTVLLVSLAESYFYAGVIQKHLFVDPILIYLAFGIMGLFGLYGTEWKTNKILRFFRIINHVGVYVFAAIYYFFHILQKVSYPNYVFSKFHVIPELLVVPLGISIFGLVISSKNVILAILKKPALLFQGFSVLVIFVIIFMKNFIDLGINIWQDVSFIYKNPHATYDKKMEYKLGKQFYNYMLFIKHNTPENSKILLPPFPASPWPQSGNVPYMTYFLHPRILLNGDEYSPKYDLKADNIDYVLIDWGEMNAGYDKYTNGWPKFDVNSSEIIYWKGGSDIEVKSENYVYNTVKGKMLWGIIKVKK